MSQALPEIVDAWRMVQSRRRFQGKLPLATLKRLATDLAATHGDVVFDLEFGKDDLGIAFLQVRASAALPLTCQRTLEVFDLPVQIDSRLGLITREEDEAGLPAGYEPLLTADGALRLADVVEDELILAVPVVPVKPGTEHVQQSWGGDADEAETPAKPNPFTALKHMKISQ
jgi:uncharacterized protein